MITKALALALAAFPFASGAWARPREFREDAGRRLTRSWPSPAGKAERYKSDPKYRRDREVDIRHVRLEIEVDISSKTISAIAIHRFTVLKPELDHLALDAKRLDVKKVTDGKGKNLDFETGEEKLTVHWAKPLPAGAEAEIRIEYSASPDPMGLHFFKADPRYPGRPDMVWSQGEAEENSFWIPLYDYPNERSSTEVLATVPEGFAAVSNGRLISSGTAPGKPGRVVWHWLQERPHVSYLITLSVGRFARVARAAVVMQESQPRDVPMTAWVLPGREEEARITFAKTPAMVTYFSELLDTPFPWDRYDEVAVYQFPGGMENTGATNILDRALIDKRASLDNDSDGLISHELAHSWFGNLITCKDWSHIWINEGITSYFQALWKLKDQGPDEFAYDMYWKAQEVFGEEGSYARATVTDRYESPDDMFDAQTYEKGAWITHMLRKELGEERFWKSLKLYIKRHKDGVAETEDLRRAVEDATGRSMQEFFGQWLYSPGTPSLKLESSWDQSEKKLTLKISQKQEHGRFVLKLPIELVGRAGRRVTVDISKKEETFSWELPARPRQIRVDPDMTLLAGYELKFPEEMLVEQLRTDPAAQGRIRAARTLSDKPGPKAFAALRECMLKDKFWGVAATCASEIGSVGGGAARAALTEGTRNAHPKVRKAVAEALGGFLRQREALEALRPLAEKDMSVSVEAAALSSIGKLRLAEGRPLLESKLSVDSWNDSVRRSALKALGELKDDSLLPLLQDWASVGRPYRVRQAALEGLGKAGEDKEGVRDFVANCLETDEDRGVMGAAIGALTSLGDPRANSSLSRIAARDLDPSMKRRASEAMESIREGRKGKVSELAERVDKLVDQLEKIEKKVSELEKGKR